jgi:hypothetical protein
VIFLSTVAVLSSTRGAKPMDGSSRRTRAIANICRSPLAPDNPQILLYGQIRKYLFVLRDIPDPETKNPKRRLSGNIHPAEFDLSRRDRDYSHNGLQSRCFSRPLSSHEADHFPVFNKEGDILQNLATAIEGIDIFYP